MGLTVDSTLGAIFVGFAVACCVYGILLTQIFSYFWRYPLDKLHFKAFVIIILLLETADQVFIGHLVYYYSITNYANPAALLLATMTWSLILQLTMGACVGAMVKSYFAFRVWRFSGRNIFITGLILLLTISQLGTAIAYTVEAFKLPSIFAAHQIELLGSFSLALGVVTDIITAGSLCFFLNRLRTGYTASDGLVNNLCSYAINTGVLTSTVSLITLVLYNAMPGTNLYFVATYFLLSKLYAISFLATLNTRRTVRGRGTDRQGATNNTNMFHLGTRLPSMGPEELSKTYPESDFPFNSFHPGTKAMQFSEP